jgi:hypothetical protein
MADYQATLEPFMCAQRLQENRFYVSDSMIAQEGGA